MAIHIDIYAHLKKSQLIKEGEQLKKYVESLEKDVNVSQVRNAKSRSKELTKLADQQARTYNTAINASDTFTKAKKREAEAEAELLRLKKLSKKEIVDEKKHVEALTAASQAAAAATQDRVYAAQRLDAATRSLNQANDALIAGNDKHTKNARKVGGLLTANATRMGKLSAATNKQRREMQSLHTANQGVIKDNAAIAKGLQRTGDAAEKTATETNKLNEMIKEGVTDYKQLRAQSDRVVAAHKAERRVITEVTSGMEDLVKQHKLQRVVVDANQKSLKQYAATAQQTGKQIKDLHKSNAQLIDGNTKLSRSFMAARDATKAANREHQEYKRLVANGASQDVLRKKAERVSEAYTKQAREVGAARDALNGILTERSDSRNFINSQATAMRDFANTTVDATKKVGDLRASHESAIRDNGRLARAFNIAEASIRRSLKTQQEYEQLVKSGAGKDALAKSAKAAADAFAQQRRDVDEATNSLHRHNKESQANRVRGLTGGVGEYASRNVAALTPLGRVNAGVGLPLLGLAGNFAEAGVTASQSIALLPAAATAAAAAVGTLAIGFKGFFETVGDMGDPKKFGEGLALLAPNAQQAALQIKALVDGPLGDLKAEVQDNLFANVAPQLEATVSSLGPTMSNLFGGLSKEFNKAFIGLTNVLMMPESQSSLTGIVDGIVEGFQHLLPMLSPLTQAFLTLTEVGASFLPALGDSFTNVATTFNDFIQQAARDGSLQNFIQKGIDAAGYLIDWVKRLGVIIYETFGNKTPADFAAAIEGALSVVTGIIKAIQTLSDVVNTLAPIFESVFGFLADKIGGASNLAYAFIGLWTGKKLFNAINGVAGLFGKSIGGALSGLVGTAEKSSSGITAALAKVKIPPALLSILGKGGIIAGAAYAGYEIADAMTDSDWMNDFQSSNPLGDNPVSRFINRNTPDFLGGDKFDAEGRWIDQRTIPSGAAPIDAPVDGPSLIGGGASGEPAPWAGGTDPAVGFGGDPLAIPSNAGKIELSNIPLGQFGGAEWQVPQGATDIPVDYDNLGKQGFYRPDQFKIMEQQGNVENTRQTAEEARSKYLDLVAAGNTRQEELNKASNDVKQAELKHLESLRDLKLAERGEFEDLTSQMDKFGKDLADSLGDMGAGLDKDLGISKGLAGLADNLVRFVGALATAPMIAGMKKKQAEMGFPNGEGGGMGLIGAMTISPASAMGKNKDNADAYRAQYGIDNYGLNTVTPGGAVPVDPSAFINGPTKLRKGEGVESGLEPAAASVAQMLTGMFPGITDIGGRQNRSGPQMHPNGRALDVMTGGDAGTGDAIAKFLEANYQALGVQSYIWRDIGKNLAPNEGGGPGTTYTSSGHGGPSGTNQGSHVHIQFADGAPVPGGAPVGMPGVPGATPAGGGGGGIPLVQNPDGTWTSSSPEWAKLIKRESGGNPRIVQGVQDVNSGGNEATGLFQIAKGTWESNGGLAYAPNAKDATPEQQAAVAAKIFREQGGSPWGSGKGQNFGRENEDLLRAGMTGASAIAMPGVPGGAIPGMSGGLGSVPSGSGTPVFVTNWPGGGGGFGGGGGGGAGGGGAAPMTSGGPGGSKPLIGGGAVPGGTPHGPSGGPKPLVGNGALGPVGKPFIGNGAYGAGPAYTPPQPGWKRPGGLEGAWQKMLFGDEPASTPDSIFGPAIKGPGNFFPDLLKNLKGGEQRGTPADPNSPFLPPLGVGPQPFGPMTPGRVPQGGRPGDPNNPALPPLGIGPQPFGPMTPGLISQGGRPSVPTPFLPSMRLPGFAKGGEVPIMAHSGEHVLTTKDVAAMGGHQGVMQFRNQLQSFETGGPVLIGAGAEGPKAPNPEPKGESKAAPAPAPVAVPAVPVAAGPVGAPVPHGAGLGAPPGPAAAPTPVGAQHAGNTGIGSGINADLSALSGGPMAMVPGMQTGIKLAERGIEYAGQVAAIGVQGLMETFLPTGGSELANNNWLTRIAGAVAGAAPAIANMAGGASNPEGGPGGGLPPGPAGIPGLGPATPEQIAGQSMAPAAQAAPPAPNVTNFNYTANGVKGAEEAFPDAARAWEARPGQR